MPQRHVTEIIEAVVSASLGTDLSYTSLAKDIKPRLNKRSANGHRKKPEHKIKTIPHGRESALSGYNGKFHCHHRNYEECPCEQRSS